MSNQGSGVHILLMRITPLGPHILKGRVYTGANTKRWDNWEPCQRNMVSGPDLLKVTL